jgi:hypothetical protein
MRAVVRVFSYLFHGLLTLFLLAIAAMALTSGQILHLDMLPWHGQSLSYWLLFSALAGLVSLILAILRTWRLLFVLWSLAVLVVMVRGFFLGPYEFAGRPEFYRALYLSAGALIAVLGAWFQLRLKAGAGRQSEG